MAIKLLLSCLSTLISSAIIESYKVQENKDLTEHNVFIFIYFFDVHVYTLPILQNLRTEQVIDKEWGRIQQGSSEQIMDQQNEGGIR